MFAAAARDLDTVSLKKDPSAAQQGAGKRAGNVWFPARLFLHPVWQLPDFSPFW